MDALLRALTSQQNEMLTVLRQLVEAESPSTDKPAVDRCGERVGAIAQKMGAGLRFHSSRQTGNHLRAEFRLDAGKGAGQILLLGHMDTVWPLGTLARMPFRIQRGRVYGPGVFDMKSGIVIGLFALKNLRQLGIPIGKKIVMLLNADEEIGSFSSRPLTEKEARRSDVVLVLEPAYGLQGALKTSRKGVGEFQIRAKGCAAHAGMEPEKGASAIVEISRQLLRLQEIANRKQGITLNPGVVRGGTRSNVVAEEAVASVDVRIARIQDQRRVEKRLRALRPFDRRITVVVSGGFNRPPLERSPAGVALFQLARRLARPLGISLREAAVGGGSDGNFTAALGIPTLDGLGAVGEGPHALHENIVLADLPRRAALLAHLISSLGSRESLP